MLSGYCTCGCTGLRRLTCTAPGHLTCKMPSTQWPIHVAPEMSAIALEARVRISDSHRWERPSPQCGSAIYSSSTTLSAPARAAVKGHALKRMRVWWGCNAWPVVGPSCPARAARQGCARCKGCLQSSLAPGDAFSESCSGFTSECTLLFIVMKHLDETRLICRAPCSSP